MEGQVEGESEGGVQEPAEAARPVRVTLIGRPACHLCHDAREVVRAVCDRTGTAWQELDIDQDAQLHDAYWERIPVVLVDGQPVDFWRVDPARLAAALA